VPKKKEPLFTRIGRLSTGAIFRFQALVNGEEQPQLWKITGRPVQMGTRKDGRKQFGVYANYVQSSKTDQATQPSKLFDIDFTVEPLRSSAKDFAALDLRDQPGGPSGTLGELARAQGYEDDEIIDDGADT